jgi:acyl-CoA thioester hydrolase
MSTAGARRSGPGDRGKASARHRDPAFETDVAIRFNDVDVKGHVNNALILTYFETGRTAFFSHPDRAFIPHAFDFVLARIECDYLIPVRLKDRLLLRLWVTQIGRKSFTFAYHLVDASDPQRVFARGISVQVCYDYARRRTIPVPEDLRSALSAYLARS